MNAPAEALGKKVDPKFKKNMLIIGGALAFAMIAMFFAVVSKGDSSQTVAGGDAVLPGAGANTSQVKREPTPAELKLLAEKQALEAAEAKKRQESYIPPDSGPLVPVNPQAQQPAVADSQGSQVYAQGGPMYQQDPYAAQAAAPVDPAVEERLRAAEERMRRGATAQMGALVQLGAPAGGHSRVNIATASSGQGAGGSSTLQISSASADAGRDGRQIAGYGGVVQGSGMPITVVAEALEIYGAVLRSPVDTYKTGYISASIVSGPLAGAFLVGQTVLVNEGLQPKFTQMRFNGQTYRVDAIALDESTSSNAVTANLDRRILQRYVLPITMAAVGGAATALSQPAQSVAGLPGGSSSVVTSAATRDQAAAAGVAAAMQLGQRAVDADASLPIRATLPANTPIGIMLIAPVLSSDASAAAQAAAGAQFAADRAAANGMSQVAPGARSGVQTMPAALPYQMPGAQR